MPRPHPSAFWGLKAYATRNHPSSRPFNTAPRSNNFSRLWTNPNKYSRTVAPVGVPLQTRLYGVTED